VTQPASIPYPLINGVRHDWSSVEAKVGTPVNQIFLALKSLNYKRTRTRGEVRGTSPDPLAKTRGTNAYTADMELPLSEAQLLMTLLNGGVNGYGDVFFQIVVSYTENGFTTVTDTLIACSLDETDASQAQGPEALMRKFTLAPLKILFNGVDDLAVPLQGVQH
jgi:hypothetical protein